MNRDKKYMKSMNTFGLLALPKEMPLYSRASLKKSTKNNWSKNNYKNNENNNISKNNFKLLNRVYSKNKFRGVLDTTSPNNKDIFIDSDSEKPMKKVSKNTEKKNNIIGKNGCAKLVIEKVESQEPVYNNEYYKFTNQQPKDFVINPNLLPKSFSNKNLLLKYSPKTQNNKNAHRNNSNNYLIKSQQLRKYKSRLPFTQYQILNNDTLGKSNKHGSTSNLFDIDSYYFNSYNSLYEPDYLFRTQAGLNKSRKKKGITTISRKRYNLKKSNDFRHKDSSLGKTYIMYTSDSNGLNSYNQEFTISNNIDNTTYQYLYNNTDSSQRYLIKEPKNYSLYNSYKNLAKMKTSGKLSKNNNAYNSKIINSFPRYKDKIVKIQSIWRGAYLREIMTFILNINKFKIIIDKIIKCHLYDYFICFTDIVIKGNKKDSAEKIFVNRRFEYSKYKEDNKNKEKENKRMDAYKQDLSQNETDYENLLQNYNSLISELQNIINSTEDNNTNDKSTLKDILKNHKLITNGYNDGKSIRPKTMNDNNQSISNHFISNLKIINNEQILIDNSEATKNFSKENISDKNESDKKREVAYKDTINKEIITQFMIENKYKDNDKNKPQNYQERNIIICQNELFTLADRAIPQFNSNHPDNKNNIIDNNKQGFSYIQKEEKETTPNDNNNLNYNLTNKMEKKHTIEINPTVMKKNKNNILFAHENIFEVLNSNNSIFTEKAKRNMMKIILPIKLKITLRKFIHRSIFSLLINISEKVSNPPLEENVCASIKEFIKEEREKAKSIKSSFYNKYKVEQTKKKEIQRILVDYAIFKWNKLLYEMAKEIISNKNAIMKK